MLKKLRWRFITVAMAAFSTVIISLLLIVNISTYYSITKQLNETLQMLTKMKTEKPIPFPAGTSPPPEFHRDFSPEFQYMLRFFAVYTNDKNEIVKINQDYIASVSKDDAINYAEYVLRRKSTSGYYNNYRYTITKTSTGNIILFLNSERELQLMKSLFLSTTGIAACCLLAVFTLIVIFSKKAIAPYVRNIETQKRFITDAGHELKTPLTAITTSADVLSMEYENNEWIQNIQHQSNKMSKLIAELITLSRLDEERPFPDITEFVLTEAVWEISEPFATLATTNGKEYIQHIEEDLILCGDKNAIQQMISILLDNALKYSNENGKIRLDVHKKRKQIEIIVYNTCLADNIPDLERVFDRFYRADQSRNRKNSYGIGLSIAQSIAHNHGGYIKVDSNDGASITFTIRI
ncbi:MAG: sensor histidine kinase [Lachnospiraceae bacterium]